MFIMEVHKGVVNGENAERHWRLGKIESSAESIFVW